MDWRARETPCESKLQCTENDEKLKEARKYREAVGRLIDLSICSGADLSYVVGKTSQHSAELSEEHWTTVKRLLRYLKGTAEKEF